MKAIVGIREVHVRWVAVTVPENAAEEDIKNEAELMQGEELDIEYSHTLSQETWTVEYTKI